MSYQVRNSLQAHSLLARAFPFVTTRLLEEGLRGLRGRASSIRRAAQHQHDLNHVAQNIRMLEQRIEYIIDIPRSMFAANYQDDKHSVSAGAALSVAEILLLDTLCSGSINRSD